MPLTVRAWPDSTDPRGSHFSLIGFAFGMVPPNKYRLATTGALSPFDDLNDGVLLTLSDESPPVTTYTSADGAYVVVKTGFSSVQPLPTPHTVVWVMTLTRAGEPVYEATNHAEYPDAIRNEVFNPAPIGGGPDKIPLPVTMAPQNHLVTS